jgi:hypothetical protein
LKTLPITATESRLYVLSDPYPTSNQDFSK